MDVKEPRDPAVFVVTVRTGGGEDAVRGCVAPVLAAGALDLSRFCAAPLITYCAAKGMNHGHRQDG